MDFFITLRNINKFGYPAVKYPHILHGFVSSKTQAAEPESSTPLIPNPVIRHDLGSVTPPALPSSQLLSILFISTDAYPLLSFSLF
jgi:hypothetical protein